MGRLRGTTYLKPVDIPDEPSQWVTCKALAGHAPRDLATMEVVRDRSLTAHVVLHAKPARDCKHRNRCGLPACDSKSRKNARRESELWLSMASPSLRLNAGQLVSLYVRRMQIELSFRDLKSHRHGQAFEDSLTRSGQRIEILLLVSAPAGFACWLAGMAAEATGVARWPMPIHSMRRLYSTLRTGREALVRDWPMERTSQWLERLQTLPSSRFDQMTVRA